MPIYSRRFGAAIPFSLRWGLFGLSEEAYLTAHNLSDFGLIDWTVPPADSGADYSTEPHRFFWPPRTGHGEIENKPALDVVLADLKHDYPERMYPAAAQGLGPRETQRLVRGLSTL